MPRARIQSQFPFNPLVARNPNFMSFRVAKWGGKLAENDVHSYFKFGLCMACESANHWCLHATVVPPVVFKTYGSSLQALCMHAMHSLFECHTSHPQKVL
jgi:hypothetical protein